MHPEQKRIYQSMTPEKKLMIAADLYYSARALKAAGLKPSARGELEITDGNRAYLRTGKLRVELMGRGIAWLDTGTHQSLLQAGEFIETIETRQGLKIAWVEEIAYRVGDIEAEQLEKLAEPLLKSNYGRYLLGMLKDRR